MHKLASLLLLVAAPAFAQPGPAPAPSAERPAPRAIGTWADWEAFAAREAGGAVCYALSRPFSSIASVGFALTAYPIGVERGWVSRTQAVDRTLTTLRFFRDLPQGTQATGQGGLRGFYYHFLDMETGHRYDTWVELSSVDTALLMMGVLFAQSYYDRDEAREREIRELAEQLYRRVDWAWLQRRPPLVSMGWFPESGFIEHDWRGYNEAMLL